MATVVVGCMCLHSTIVEGTGIMQIQPKNGLWPVAIFTGMEAESGRPSLALAMRVSRAMPVHLVRSTSLQRQPQTHTVMQEGHAYAATLAGWALIEMHLQGFQHVTMAIVLIVYEVVQSLMLIHSTTVK